MLDPCSLESDVVSDLIPFTTFSDDMQVKGEFMRVDLQTLRPEMSFQFLRNSMCDTWHKKCKGSPCFVLKVIHKY